MALYTVAGVTWVVGVVKVGVIMVVNGAVSVTVVGVRVEVSGGRCECRVADAWKVVRQRDGLGAHPASAEQNQSKKKRSQGCRHRAGHGRGTVGGKQRLDWAVSCACLTHLGP